MGALVYQSFADFTTADHEPKEFVLEPWLPKRGIGMVYGWRGVGKTFLVQWIAYAIATGASVLDWEVSKPRRVLHVDAEMDPIDLVDRYKAIQATAMREGNGNPELAAENLMVLTDAQQEDGIPNLALPEARREIQKVLRETGAEVLILDNLSTLCQDGSENSDESWSGMQAWLRELRRENITVLLVHHSGKGGAQRGTSKHEDIMNTVIALREHKANVELCFEKHRGFAAPDKFDWQLDYDEREVCTIRRVVDQTATILALVAAGVPYRSIKAQLGVSTGTISARVTEHREKMVALAKEGVHTLRAV